MKLTGHDRIPHCRRLFLWGLGLLVLLLSAPGQAVTLALTEEELEWVGQQVFRNECGGRQRCLVHWNEGEAFPSLGIGHFIWYPAGKTGRFKESFPDLVAFLREQGATLPGWLTRLEPMDAPWPDRATFLAVERSDERIPGLRRFLMDHQGLQVAFLFRRAQRALADIAEASRVPALTRQKLGLLASTPGGVYALIDYVNFKGEGLSPTERYQGEGWGLLQVIETMALPASERVAVEAFRDAAATVLRRRSELAENAIERERWLPGWLKRLETYQQPHETP
ncbi:hypothetical protein SAMN05216203_0830 [Marinobacter daqiaonensis]|uniref:Uncharacterized protein n=1 Tax=Marinobacter daqiaonensis TaxID=650891 RepID=A0A1I6H3L6_9GAMM|nr:hypothetical protein [Marinobacter daqiaonensis]SFR48967.1 hypothetical protein SAMN05216203_0830 [Marinobacter daqiaonensis]